MRAIDSIREMVGGDDLIMPVWSFDDASIIVTCYRSPGMRTFVIVEHKGVDLWQAYLPIGIWSISKAQTMETIGQFLAHPSLCDEDNRLGICEHCNHAAWNLGNCEIEKAGR